MIAILDNSPDWVRVTARVSLATLLSLAASPVHAQSGPHFAAYEHMGCPELDRERQDLRRALVHMQSPAGIDDPLWTRTSNAYGLVNQLIMKKCRRLSNTEQLLPAPPRVALMPEKQLVIVAMRAIRNGRTRAGQNLLLQGSHAGYASAQFNLGMVYYLLGKTAASESWLRSAAQQGHAQAAKMLESMHARNK